MIMLLLTTDYKLTSLSISISLSSSLIVYQMTYTTKHLKWRAAQVTMRLHTRGGWYYTFVYFDAKQKDATLKQLFSTSGNNLHYTTTK